jgi:M-phase inducer tyrosine phosphatase
MRFTAICFLFQKERNRAVLLDFDGIFETHIVLDCRFPYEYNAGHISGAVNLTSLELMRDLYDHFCGHNVCFVFHCEFSHTRGPTWAMRFCAFDQLRNLKEAGGLTTHYPNVFILNGGSKAIQCTIDS